VSFTMSGTETALRRAREELASREAELEEQGERLREAEIQLGRARDRFSRFFELAPVGYLILDADGRVELANRHVEEVLGRAGDDLVGKPLWAFSVGDSDSLGDWLRDVAEGAGPSVLQARFESAAPGEIPVSLHAVGDAGSALVAVLDGREEARARHMQREFVHRLLRAQDAERRHIARELHDEAGQTLTAIELGLGKLAQATELDEVRAQARTLTELVQRTVAEVRRLARGLYPAVLDDLGLPPALERLAAEQRELAGVPIELRLARLESLPAEAALTVYRVAQEALSNAIRHAQPGRIQLTARRVGDVVNLTIVDDGKGFVPGARYRAGLGLRGMRERVEQLEGTFDVESIPGDGTSIRASIPIGDDDS